MFEAVSFGVQFRMLQKQKATTAAMVLQARKTKDLLLRADTMSRHSGETRRTDFMFPVHCTEFIKV